MNRAQREAHARLLATLPVRVHEQRAEQDLRGHVYQVASRRVKSKKPDRYKFRIRPE